MADAVASSLFAEATKVAKILSDLSWSYLKLRTELLRAYDFDSFFQEPVENADVLGQPGDHDFGHVRPVRLAGLVTYHSCIRSFAPESSPPTKRAKAGN